MKAIVSIKDGSPDVLQFREIKDTYSTGRSGFNQRGHAVALNAAVCHIMRGSPLVARLMFALLKPRYKNKQRLLLKNETSNTT